MAEWELLRTRIDSEQDVFDVRRKGRQLAAALGLENQDQIRVAAALSEVGRRMLALGRVEVDACLRVLQADRAEPSATLEFRATVPQVADDGFVAAVGLARGLMDVWSIERASDRTTVIMGRAVQDRAAQFSDAKLAAIRNDLAETVTGTPLEELAEHNRQLLSTLAEVQAHRDELLRLNQELEETNRGVMALYTELSGELEATNRGVVALHSELEQRSSQLRQASEAKTRFLANVTHELRSPVTSIVGLIRLLQDPDSESLSAEQSRQLGLIDSSARNMLTLVNDLLDLAKAESGSLRPAPEDTDLKPIFDTLRGTMRAVPTGKDARLTVDDPPAMSRVHTDPVMLAQVLRNLLTNALKFTPAGEVRLSAVQQGQHVELTVSDTGIGIPPAEQERVFEEFYQVKHPLQARSTGTGLGLPYARRLAEALGGTLTLDSEPGVGSRFTVRIPIGQTAAPDSEGAVTVLLVDDDEAFRTAAGSTLRRGGFTVREAADGRTGLLSASVHRPDVIVLDLRLAELDGFAVLSALQDDETLRDIPVVVVTAYPGDVTDADALAHAVTVLDKTDTTLDDLCAVVRITVADPGETR